ncbi:hypothetical protein L1987_17292 [Smallanthus sonchifolius]|uniref:Uncharacterized protein n=1 Tax=Smallanthus sonchifolius TaxID=185202 RepID=A0ACB9IYP9_9ASTR|nr:hypothetical protein L1987_17292 [Smallanthus sonchifolius]
MSEATGNGLDEVEDRDQDCDWLKVFVLPFEKGLFHMDSEFFTEFYSQLNMNIIIESMRFEDDDFREEPRGKDIPSYSRKIKI